ncbi:MAG: PqqD family protein [Chloroflexota bacterium]
MEMQNVQYKVHPETISSEVENQVVLLQYESGVYFTLNEVGTNIWQLIEEEKTHQQIINELQRMYDVNEERLNQDVLALVKQLKEKGLIS